jgi:DNA modification methylase
MRVEQIGDCTLYLADCRDVLPTLGKVDAVITSPPYDDMRDYGEKFTGFDWRQFIAPIAKTLDAGAVLVWNVADQHKNGSETGNSMRQAIAFMDAGLRLHDTMIYSKPSFSFPESNRYPQTWEYMFVFSCGTPKTFNPIKDRKNLYAGTKVHGTQRQKDGSTVPASGNGKMLSEYGARHNVWLINNRADDNTGEHPAPFPLSLAVDHARSWTNAGDVILDPFMGSGTTGVACVKLGRKFIGIEREPEYFEIACRRIREAYAQPDMFIEQAKPMKQDSFL